MITTHTYAVLKISHEAYAEIRAKLEAAGYSDQIRTVANRQREIEAIDMHGIAVQAKDDE